MDTYVGVYRSTFTTIYDRLTWRLKIKHTLEKQNKKQERKGKQQSINRSCGINDAGKLICCFVTQSQNKTKKGGVAKDAVP